MSAPVQNLNQKNYFENQAEKLLDDDDEEVNLQQDDDEEEDNGQRPFKDGMFDTLKLFNLTQEGRLKPERERLRHQIISQD